MITFRDTDPQFCDLSKYRTIGDEAAFRAAKPVALGFRVHSDLSGPDPTWPRDEAIAASLGIPRLGYDYEDNGTAEDYLALFPPAPGRLHVLDAEYKGLTLAEAESWAETVEHACGAPAVLYGHALLASWNPKAGSPLRRMPSWQATYGMSLNPVPWALEPFAWQYSDGQAQWVTVNGKREFHWYSPGPRYFAGVGACDMNTLRIPVADLRALAGLDQHQEDDMLDPVKDKAAFQTMLADALGTPSEAAWEAYLIGHGDASIPGRGHRDGMGDWYEKGFAAGTQVATLNGQVASLSAAVKALQEALAAGEIPSGTKASITFD